MIGEPLSEKPNGEVNILFRAGEDGRTYMARQFFRIPLQILRPHYYDVDGTAIVYSLNPSGGVLQHDRLLTEIECEAGSSAVFTTPGNTKYYKMDEGCARIHNRIMIRDGAVLEYLPEHNVPFAKARVYQDTEFYVESDAVLFAVDMVTPGRVASGEAFEYNRYQSKVRIYIDGSLELYDNCSLDPSIEDLRQIGYLDGYLTNGSFYVYARGMDPQLKERINRIETDHVRLAAGNLSSDLMTVRFLGDSMIHMTEMVQRVWDECRRSILNKPALRLRKEFSGCSG